MTGTGLRRALYSVASVATAAVLTTSANISTELAGVNGRTIPQSRLDPKLEPLFAQAGTGSRLPPTGLARYTIRRATLTLSDTALRDGMILNAEAHLFNLFPDVELVALRSRAESHSNRDYSWFGYIPGDQYGRAIVTVFNGKLGVVVTHSRGRYMVLPVADGLYEVLEIDEARFPDSDANSPPVSRDPSRTLATTSRTARTIGARSLDVGGLIWLFDWTFARFNGDIPSYGPLPDDGSVVDVMFVYTHGATTVTDFPGTSLSHDGPHAPPWSLLNEIRLALDEVNLSLAESGVQTRLKMVPNYPWEEVTHLDRVAGDGIYADLEALHQLQAVITRREEVAADLVVVITSGDDDPEDDPATVVDESASNDCGTGFVTEFVAIDASCLSWGILAHELGHKFKLGHDWYTHLHVEGGSEPSSWEDTYDGRAYVQIGSQENVRTPTSYKTQCEDQGVTCRVVSRWSNPADFTFNNLPLGVWQGLPYPSNEVRVLNQTRVDVARVRDSICRLLSQC